MSPLTLKLSFIESRVLTSWLGCLLLKLTVLKESTKPLTLRTAPPKAKLPIYLVSSILSSGWPYSAGLARNLPIDLVAIPVTLNGTPAIPGKIESILRPPAIILPPTSLLCRAATLFIPSAVPKKISPKKLGIALTKLNPVEVTALTAFVGTLATANTEFKRSLLLASKNQERSLWPSATLCSLLANPLIVSERLKEKYDLGFFI